MTLLPAFAAALWLGMLVAAPKAPPPTLLGGALLLGCLSIAWRPGIVRWGLLLIAGIALGGGWLGFHVQGVEHSVLARPGVVHIEGVLRDDPEPSQFGWRAIIHTEIVTRSSGATRVVQPLWVEGAGAVPSARRGDRIALDGELEVPSDEGFSDFLSSQGIAATFQVDTFARLGPSANAVVRASDALRTSFRSAIGELFTPREGGLLLGLALGDRAELDASVRRDFQATGLTHLLAVSGGNLAMVLAPLLGLVAFLGWAPGVRVAIGVGVVVFFVVLTGGEASILRAGVMALLTLGAIAVGRPRAAWPVLGASVCLLLLFDPFLYAQVGFQLSVSATAGIIAFTPKLAERLSWLPRPIALAFATTLGAQLGVGPLLLATFHWLPLVSVLANVIAFPIVEPAMLIGLAAAAVVHVAPWLAHALAWVDGFALGSLQGIADALATLPIPALTSGGGLLPLMLGGGVVLLSGLWINGHLRIPRSLVIGGCLVLPVFVWSGAVGVGPPSGLTVRMMNVGQGDAVLVTSPGGATILVDGGPDEDAVAVHLAQLGIRRLDMVVATHQHADHVEGLPQVLARFPVGVVLEPGCPQDLPAYADFTQAIADEHLPVRYPRTGDEFQVGDVHMDVLSPPDCFQGTNSEPNNDSIVIRLSIGEDVVLLTGDAEVDAQDAMLQDPVVAAELIAPVFKVPHHGGDTSADGFFQAVHPQVALISVGADNDYGHPVPSVIAALEAAGAQVYRTDQLGDVIVRFDSKAPGGLVVASDR